MDFPAPKPILDALRKALDHGVLGYELASKQLLETVAARMEHLYGWKVKPEAIVPVTGIVNGLILQHVRSVRRKRDTSSSRLFIMKSIGIFSKSRQRRRACSCCVTRITRWGSSFRVGIYYEWRRSVWRIRF
ncbi:MAG TPA: hypothetical protein VMN99_01405 [Anaerolineales bacterium]|nr:hypothetical protein [Anaerolineales bacterium]